MYSKTITALAALLAVSSAAPVKRSTLESHKGRGLVYNEKDAAVTYFDSVDWAYNWASSPSIDWDTLKSKGVEFVPMLHSDKGVDYWRKDVDDAVSHGTKHILSFNEPEQPVEVGGSGLDAGYAAGLYQTHVTSLKQAYPDLQLGAPGVSAAPQGLEWLRSFKAACGNNCPVDYIPLHFYNYEAGVDWQLTSLKGWLQTTIPVVQELFKKEDGSKPAIWLTEFGYTPHGGDAAHAEYLGKALPWLDSEESGIEKYSYFKAEEMKNGGGQAAGVYTTA